MRLPLNDDRVQDDRAENEALWKDSLAERLEALPLERIQAIWIEEMGEEPEWVIEEPTKRDWIESLLTEMATEDIEACLGDA